MDHRLFTGDVGIDALGFTGSDDSPDDSRVQGNQEFTGGYAQGRFSNEQIARFIDEKNCRPFSV